MTITIEIEGLAELRRAFTNLDQQFNTAVQDAVEDTIFAIDGEIKRRINSGPASGRTYRRRGITHQASAPGQPPMTDTGTLVRSIYLDIDPLRATVGSRLAYASYLEYGTRRMAARPVWIPVAEQEGPEFHVRVTENLSRIIR